MEKNYIQIKQGEFLMYCISMTVDELVENTIIVYYDSKKENDDGYQRPPVPSHYRKISKYFQTENEPILPPAIITAVGPEQIKKDDGCLFIKGKIRVVDGQHRIEGIKYLKMNDEISYKKISSYEFSVIVMVIPENCRIHEINTFINLNSKGKKVSTDLAIQLREKVRKKSYNATFESIKESIATNIVNRINDTTNSVWYKSIRVGDANSKNRPISINIFNQSLKEIISNYLELGLEIRNKEEIQNIETIIDYLAKFIDKAWLIIENKWKPCFMGDTPMDYTIQKSIGVFSLHIILNEILLEAKGDTKKTLEKFQKIIAESKVVHRDWISGGKFSPFNSKSGVATIAKHLKNEKTPYF